MNNVYTENLSEFGFIELIEAGKLLSAIKNGFPLDFSKENVKIGFNKDFGSVFLTNENYEVCMVDDDGNLFSYYTTPYQGLEGSFEELMEEYEEMHVDDQAYMQNIKENIRKKRKWIIIILNTL